MQDSCYYCKYKKTHGYNQDLYLKCKIIGHELTTPERTICDQYLIDEVYQKEKEQEELRKKFNFRNIR